MYLIGGAEDEMAAVSTTALAHDRCVVAISYRGKILQAEATDYFKALQEVRRLMEADGLIPFCYGASLNVYPSGMSRDMAQGMVAYRTKLGRHAIQEDLVRIFDEGADVIPSFVAQQREFHEEWVQSIARLAPDLTGSPIAARLRSEHAETTSRAHRSTGGIVGPFPQSLGAAPASWPDASYFDESTESARLTLAELEQVGAQNWRRLYRHKADGSHWALDEWDKYQDRFLVRVHDLEHWDTEDHTALEKAVLLAHRGGEGADPCLWSGCTRQTVRGVAYCIDHLYAQGVRK